VQQGISNEERLLKEFLGIQKFSFDQPLQIMDSYNEYSLAVFDYNQ